MAKTATKALAAALAVPLNRLQAVEVDLPCTHGKKDICDLCLIWSGIKTVQPTARFWTNGKEGKALEYIITRDCPWHGDQPVEVAWHKDAFTAVEQGWEKVKDGGRVSCGCEMPSEDEMAEDRVDATGDLLSFVRDFYREYEPCSDVNESTEKMVARAKALIKKYKK